MARVDDQAWVSQLDYEIESGTLAPSTSSQLRFWPGNLQDLLVAAVGGLHIGAD